MNTYHIYFKRWLPDGGHHESFRVQAEDEESALERAAVDFENDVGKEGSGDWIRDRSEWDDSGFNGIFEFRGIERLTITADQAIEAFQKSKKDQDAIERLGYLLMHEVALP